MNILIDELPETVRIGPLTYPIRTDFRIWIMLELLLNDEDVAEEDKVIGALELVYESPLIDAAQALERLIWFYRCGREETIASGELDETEAVYSYDYDAEYIYAAFMSQYGIDLQTAQLHWWQFRALMRGLREDNLFVKIMGYRAMKLPPDMPKEQKSFYTKMKTLYALPRSQSEREKMSDIEAALLGSGDVSSVL